MAYNPCRNGIHVCGINGDESEFVTIGNVPEASRKMFEQLREEHALARGIDPDLVVDMMRDGDIIEDFGIRRQSLRAILPLG